ncbi:MAG TPA: c-type cytochrome [Steroidobacteraceae bacterium]|nr:c-type cytochrome [Steroidobacteraceae bacterium]
MVGRIAAAAAALSLVVSAVGQAAEEPLWAWGFQMPASAQASAASSSSEPNDKPDDRALLRVEGSGARFTRAQIINPFGPADWFPGDHPPMPGIVAHGARTGAKEIYACALCHLPNGHGRPENANLTGLTFDYIVEQLQDFRDGARRTSDSRKTNTALMAQFAQALSAEQIKSVARYFAAIPVQRWTRVIESDTVPKTRSDNGLFLALTGAQAGSEPLGNRIIEMPEDAYQTKLLRNPRVGFVAYVPRGAVQRGAGLVRSGAHRFAACVTCHGADLRGLGQAPRLAGRSPSYIARQLYDMQTGHRAGKLTALMMPVTRELTGEDILAIAAYLASLPP